MKIDSMISGWLESDVLFIAVKDKDSTDLDIYIVTELGRSQFHNFEYEGRWIEVFIDNKHTLQTKIENCDEIVINFVRTFQLIQGDSRKWEDLVNMVEDKVKDYGMPQVRKKKIMYRIHALISKLTDERLNNKFIYSSLCYHITSLLLVENKCFPESPKYWVQQLKECLDEDIWCLYEKLLNGNISCDECRYMVSILLREYNGMHLYYDKEINITFII